VATPPAHGEHDPAAHPHLAALAADLGDVTGDRHEDVVRHGLDLMIAGLRARLG
jgi:hypothetical protein